MKTAAQLFWERSPDVVTDEAPTPAPLPFMKRPGLYLAAPAAATPPIRLGSAAQVERSIERRSA